MVLYHISQWACVKTFEAEQLCILCSWQKWRKCSSSLNIVHIKKQGPIKLRKMRAHHFLTFLVREKLSELRHFCARTLLSPMFSCTLCVPMFSCLPCSVQLPCARLSWVLSTNHRRASFPFEVHAPSHSKQFCSQVASHLLFLEEDFLSRD